VAPLKIVSGDPDFQPKLKKNIEQMFQTRRFLWEFPIGSYVKLSSVVVAIMVGGLKCRTQFRKVTTQGTFQQSSFRGEFFFLILVGRPYGKFP
jgi:hypothetical protein